MKIKKKKILQKSPARNWDSFTSRRAKLLRGLFFWLPLMSLLRCTVTTKWKFMTFTSPDLYFLAKNNQVTGPSEWIYTPLLHHLHPQPKLPSVTSFDLLFMFLEITDSKIVNEKPYQNIHIEVLCTSCHCLQWQQ